MENSGKIIVYTDGGCHGNPGPGGWACVIIAEGEARQLSGGDKLTTNNKMELTAAINALSAIYNTERLRNCPVQLNIDSQYVKNGITGWIFGWKKNGWKTAAKKTGFKPRTLGKTRFSQFPLKRRMELG